MKARVLFMSTPQFGVPSLRMLAADGRFEIVGVITQPDKPAGRGLKLTPPPVKLAALELGIPVYPTPERASFALATMVRYAEWRERVAS